MALTDINFQEGDGQYMMLEVNTGVSSTPTDILIENSGTQYLLLETPLVVNQGGGGGNIFIMSE
jgi:hypothetical protein